MRARLGSSFLAILTLPGLAVACSSSHTPSTGPVLQGPEIIVPQDLVGLITSLTLSVYPQTSEAGVMLSCDDSTGIVSGDVSKVTANPVFSDFTQSCGAAGGFCTPDGGSLSIPWSSTPRIFSVIGYDSASQSDASKVAVGCTTMTLNNETTASASITLHHFLQPATCGDNTIEPPETCDDTTAACSTCQTVEELISFGGNGSGTTYGSPNQMTNPFFLWPSGMDPVSGAFMAFYTDASLTPGRPLQVTARFMDFTLSPTSSFYMVANQSSIFLPTSGGAVPQPASTNDEKEPSATVLGSNVYVAYASDKPVGGGSPNPFNIFYDSVNLSEPLTGQGPCLVSTAQAGHVLAYPSIAASGNALYVVWTDENGNVNGALVSAPGSGCVAAGTATVLGSGISATANVGPKVAAAANGGWVVVWPSSSIQMQLISSSGVPSGSPVSVGSGTNPQVASVPSSGSFAVAWNGSSGIQVQRYKKDGTTIGTSANVVTGTVATPAIAGGTSLSGVDFYAVSWIAGTSPSTTVRARFVNAASGQLTDDSGYLFNPISGQLNDDFQVSLSTTAPANPTVAIGGFNGAYVAFGWEDHGTMCTSPSTFPGTPCYGILARRFPVPVD